MKRSGLFLAIMLVIVVNLVALSGVWFNRTGAPDAVVTLTERELPVMPSEDGDSGIALGISWRSKNNDDPWLDRAKLEKIGFDCPSETVDHDVHLLRKLFVVLEYREEEIDPPEASRLFAVDAGRDPEQLRRAYPDRARQMILPAVVELEYSPDEAADKQISGRVREVLPPFIHVPEHHRALLAGADANTRYSVTLRYGRSHEPWILAVE